MAQPIPGISRKGLLNLVLAALLAIPLTASARTHTPDEVGDAATTWARRVISPHRPDAMVRQVEPYLRQGETVAYIVHFTGEGFCLSGADDLSLPVVFYCPDQPFEPDNPGLQDVLNRIGDSLLDLRQRQNAGGRAWQDIQGEVDKQAELWSDLMAGRPPSNIDLPRDRDIPEMLELPLTSAWDQRSPYNDQCPTLDGPPYDNIPSITGCVATAMSQVMYYWKWPTNGDHSLQVFWPTYHFDSVLSTPCDNDPGIDPAKWGGRLVWSDAFTPPQLQIMGTWDYSMLDEAKAISPDPQFQNAVTYLFSHAAIYFQIMESDFTTAYYDWDLIQDQHTDADGLDEGDTQVARLCYDASVSVDMNWGRYESLAVPGEVPGSLAYFFRYDGDANFWIMTSPQICEELSWYRPLVMSGFNGSGGGHAWVVFGYDFSYGWYVFKMNMGWGPSSIGYYTRETIPHGFTVDQAFTNMIAPRSKVRFVAESAMFGDGTPSNPYDNLDAALADAPDETILIFQAGSTHLVSGSTAVLNTPHTYKGRGVVLAHE